MRRSPTYTVADLPDGLIRLSCTKCGRFGQYRKATLVERFSEKAALPQVLRLLANCERHGRMSDPCLAKFLDPANL